MKCKSVIYIVLQNAAVTMLVHGALVLVCC